MENQAKKVVAFLTQNQKLCNSLQAALKGRVVVVRAENIEAINNIIKQSPVKAVVLHIVGSAGWIIFELLKTGYPNIPRYAILAPSLTKNDFDPEALAKKYGAAAITNEKSSIKSIATLLEANSWEEIAGDSTGKETYMEIYGNVARELERLQQEFTVTGMRTLPQPVIGDDTKKRLNNVLQKLKGIKITP
jgi:hypothetical protein